MKRRREVDLAEFESDLHAQITADLRQQEMKIEKARLDKVSTDMSKMRQRLAKLSQGAQFRRIQERLEELLVEEEAIKERMNSLSASANDKVSNAAAGGSECSIDALLKETSFEDVFGREKEESRECSEEGEESDFAEKSSKADGFEEGDEEADFLDDFNEEDYEKRLSGIKVDQIETVDLQISPFKAPKDFIDRLFPYQQQGVMWMLKLHTLRVGGILGDEMGLGKTVQVVALIACLFCSGLLTAPVLIVCPATLIRQWLSELHSWFPALRVLVLHAALSPSGASIQRLLDTAFTSAHVVITSYGHLAKHNKRLVDRAKWKAVFLDEGHKIRNPHAAITAVCKRSLTTHRYILSGTPIQNNLVELWSLIDFCFPGKLGTLSVFREEFSLPISAGGWVNASKSQVERAYTAACSLKSLIEPFLLRRLKADVAKELPEKHEKVIFCQLTEYQRSLYETFLQSEQVHSILLGKRNILSGIDVLRKICNHPALVEAAWVGDAPADAHEHSGKLSVLAQVLSDWKDHRVLVFCQTRQMLDIVEAFIRLHFQSRQFLRMDGTTPVAIRTRLVDQFNKSPLIFAFFLTTRVGGLGVNLTGADRVVIFDPDWNPSTDLQARERSWRLGQSRPVTIYRLITEGTVEEKIFHRQVFKTFLTMRILKDPKQTRFFKHSDLHDLFTLGGIARAEHSADDAAEPGGGKLFSDILELSGLQRTVSQDRRFSAHSRQTVNDSIALLQASGRERRSRLGIADTGKIDQLDLLNAIRQIASQADPQVVKLAKSVVRFIKSRKQCSSDELFRQFQPDSCTDALLLRQVLKAVATLNKDRHLWTLKPDFEAEV